MRIPAALAAVTLICQVAPAAQDGPRYDVVSIKRNTTNALGSNGSVPTRPDGGFMMLNIPAIYFLGQAFDAAPADMIGIPEWARRDRWDISATSSLTRPTPEQRRAMVRAMLVDRMGLRYRIEKREQPVYELVTARADRALGPGLTKSTLDCDAINAERRAAADAALAAGQSPASPVAADDRRCVMNGTGDRWQGDATMAGLAQLFRPSAGRVIVDKTGLTGSYTVNVSFDRMAALRGPSAEPQPGAAPSIFSALPEQLGLKLEPATMLRDTVIIERLERPTEN